MRRLALFSLFAVSGVLVVVGAAVIVASFGTMAPVDIIVYAAGAGVAIALLGSGGIVIGVRLMRGRRVQQTRLAR